MLTLFHFKHFSGLDRLLLFSCVILVYMSSSAFGVLNQFDPNCGKTQLTSLQGTIVSPHYPESYSHKTICEWYIYSPPKSILKINILDLDIEEDISCIHFPCCTRNWLSLPREGGRGTVQLCGNNLTLNPITVSQPVTPIKFHTANAIKGGRGFKITYSIDIQTCKPYDLQCANGKCISNSSLCNGTDDCGDESDERNCGVRILGASKVILESIKKAVQSNNILESNAVCSEGTIPCPSSPDHCYSPELHFCDGKFDCPRGDDELGCAIGCPKQIACSSGYGCYSPIHRCNSVPNCRDNSDETDCPEEPCGHLQFVCLNGKCVSGSAICNGDDDCGDLSDEESCTKTSLMTAAIMGLLACIFLFVIGLGCLYRVYTVRLRASAAFIQHLEPEPMDENFIYREPPPAYSVAVNDTRVIAYPASEITERFFENNPSPRNHRTRSRRSRRRPRSTETNCVTPRSRPRASNIFPNDVPNLCHTNITLPVPEPATHSHPKVNECNKNQPNVASSDVLAGHIELCGLVFQDQNQPHTTNNVSTSSCPNESPCSSPSLSPSRESVTSSTSLEDQEDLVTSCQS